MKPGRIKVLTVKRLDYFLPRMEKKAAYYRVKADLKEMGIHVAVRTLQRWHCQLSPY